MNPAVAFAPSAAFIRYPEKAAYGRNLPKNKIYEHSGANTRLRNMFVEQVDQIVWEYKLAPETINLPARPDVPEIQVFSIKLKTQELKHDVLRCIDGAVQFPIIFELHFEDRTQVVAAYKRRCGTDDSRWVISEYFSTPWQHSSIDRFTLPLVLDLKNLYERLLIPIIGLPARADETIKSILIRATDIKAKQKALVSIEKKLKEERQFNRKVLLNMELRKLATELDRLGASK